MHHNWPESWPIQVSAGCQNCVISFFPDGKVQAAVLIGSGYNYAAEIGKVSTPGAILKILNYHDISCNW